MKDQTSDAAGPGSHETISGEVSDISCAMTRLRLMVGRRVIGRLAIARLTPGLELSHLDVLEIVARAQGDVTVGAIARAMRIDPSRGSRMATDMVARGLLVREASQQDARRSIVGITPQGRAILEAMREAATGVLNEALKDWPKEDVAAFARLFDRFVGRVETRLASRLPPERAPL